MQGLGEDLSWVPAHKVATQRFPNERELRLKVCLLGEPSVGKTSLIRRFVHDIFDDAYVETLGAKVSTKELRVRHRSSGVAFHLLLHLWDIAGQHRVDFVTPDHYRGAAGALVAIDLTRRGTLEAVPAWVETFRASAGDVPVLLLVNKQDLAAVADIAPAALRRAAQDCGVTPVGTSARTGAGVEEAIRLLLSELLEPHLRA